ncbi:MAG: hypothetical protein DRI61_15820, partial [Chloroflexi bacterium]
MKKIYIFGMIMLLLVAGLTTAGSVKTKIVLEHDKDKHDKLIDFGFTNPQIEECIAIDEYKCKAKIHQTQIIQVWDNVNEVMYDKEVNVLNKDIKITYKYCKRYDDEVCTHWKTMSK